MEYSLKNNNLFMKLNLAIFFISIIFFSCNKGYKIRDKEGNLILKKEVINDSIKKHTFYNKNGTIRGISYQKYSPYYIEEFITTFYSNEMVHQKGKKKYSKKNGWWYTYDSITSKIIGKEYFINNRRYTYVQLDTLGKCKYYEMRPYLEGYEEEDTIYVSKTDSLSLKFYKSKEKININRFEIRAISFNVGDDYQGYLTVYEYNPMYIYIYDIYKIFGNNVGLYYIDFQASNRLHVTPCCCDSVFFDYSSRFINIR